MASEAEILLYSSTDRADEYRHVQCLRMPPLVQSFVTQHLDFFIIKAFHILEVARMLRNSSTLLEQVDDVGQVLLLREVLDISHEQVNRDVC